MEIELLKTFIEVSNQKHFGKAAKRLCITQSAVSFRIKQLEAALGVKLFTRERNNIQLSLYGKRLLIHANSIIQNVEDVYEDILALSSGKRSINICAPTIIWESFLNPLIPKLISQTPDLHITSSILTMVQSIKGLLELSIDVAFVFEPPCEAKLQCQEIGNISILPVGRIESSNVKDFNSKRFVEIAWEERGKTWQQGKLSDNESCVLKADSSFTALNYILQCGGSAFLPEKTASPFLKEQKIFINSAIKRKSKKIYIIYHKDNEQIAQIDSIVKLLAALSMQQ